MKLGHAQGTFAILIGIERYGEPKMTLNGPAMDALRMGTWLLSRGVAGSRIRLYINEDHSIDEALGRERASLKAELVEAGALLNEAPTRAVLESALDPLSLPELEGAGEKTLIIYASGHGLWRGGIHPERFLLCEDATLQACHAVSLALVANRLSQHRGTNRFSRQWLILDACAQQVGRLPLMALSVANQNEDALFNAQFILGATRPGALAINDPKLQGGAFTGALLETLAMRQQLEALDIHELLADLAKTAWAHANPTNLFHRDELLQHSAAVAGASATSAHALLALGQVLDNTQVMTTDLLRTVAIRLVNDTRDFPSDVKEMLHLLDSVVGEDGCDLTTVEQFAIRLYAVLRQIRRQSSDTRWDADIAALDNWINKWPRLRANPSVNQWLGKLERESRAMAQSDLVVIDLSGSMDAQQARVWFCCDGVFTEGRFFDTPQPLLIDRLRSALTQACTQFGINDSTVFEVVLPANEVFQAYIGLEFSAVGAQTYFLGHPPALLALRVLERWKEPGWQRAWQRSWLRAGVAAERVPRMAWLQNTNAGDEGEWSWPGSIDVSRDHDALQQFLREGAACAAWCAPGDKDSVTSIVKTEPYVRLLYTRKSLATLNLAGSPGVTYIFDNPDHIPPGAAEGLFQPPVKVYP